jgi:hypothetical protein
MASTSSLARGGILTIVLPLAALGAGATAMVLGLTNTTTTTSVRHRLTANEVRSWLVRAGLDAKALAAVLVPPGQVGTLVGGAVDYIAPNSLAMDQADRAVADARASVKRFEQLVRTGQASEADARQLASARDALTAAHGQLDTHVAAVFSAATSALSPEARASLQAIRRTRGHGLPVEFLMVDRVGADWTALRDALSARDIAQREGRQFQGQAAQIVNAATSTAAVAAANNVRVNLRAIQSAWDQAVSAAEGR